MGFEVYIFGFESGGPEWFPAQRVREAFGAYVSDGSPAYVWSLHYNGRHVGGIRLMRHPNDPSLIQGFSVDRPGGDIRMWNTLAAFLASGPFAFVFASGHPPLIGNPDVTKHLPADMSTSMGVVKSGQEILDEIQKR